MSQSVELLLRTPSVSLTLTPVLRPTKPTSVALLKPDNIAGYLARDWNLSPRYANQVASAMMVSAHRYELDPVLLLAVAGTESSFQHHVGNPGGGQDPMKPFGIMQVAGRWHQEKFPYGAVKVTSVAENIDIGAQVLKEYLEDEAGNERRALLRYNGSLNLSDSYFRKVSRIKQQVLQGLSEQHESS